jgi:hypothetical protein
MSDTFWTALLAGVLALAGSLVGYIASAIQSSKAFERQRSLDQEKRQWHLQDATSMQHAAVRDRRCEQAEQFVAAMTLDFHEFRTQSTLLLKLPLQSPELAKVSAFAYWQDVMDKRVFVYGSVVAALHSEEHDLVTPWKGMEQAWLDMAHHYQFIYSQKVANGVEVPDHAAISQAIYDVYGAYNRAHAQFITTIDAIRCSNAYPRLSRAP